MACTECHATPGQGTHPSGTLDLAWGPLASSGGATPSFNADQPHLRQLLPRRHARRRLPPDARLDRRRGRGHLRQLPRQPASVPPPVRRRHGQLRRLPPGLHARLGRPGHPRERRPSTVTLSCTSCHGDATRAATTLNPLLAAAPPVDTKGNTATTARGVGAHQRHLVAGALSAGTACGECHATVPSSAHSNGVVEVVFGTLARTGSVTPAWNGSRLRLELLPRQLQERSHHLRPQLDGPRGECLRHLPRPASRRNPPGQRGLRDLPHRLHRHDRQPGQPRERRHRRRRPLLHVLPRDGGRASVAGADVNQASAPPVDTSGATTGVAVGTHLAHVNPAVAGAVYKPVACTECHPTTRAAPTPMAS